MIARSLPTLLLGAVVLAALLPPASANHLPPPPCTAYGTFDVLTRSGTLQPGELLTIGMAGILQDRVFLAVHVTGPTEYLFYSNDADTQGHIWIVEQGGPDLLRPGLRTTTPSPYTDVCFVLENVGTTTIAASALLVRMD